LKLRKINLNYIIGGIYRHPNNSIQEFHKSLYSVLNRISMQKCPRITVEYVDT